MTLNDVAKFLGKSRDGMMKAFKRTLDGVHDPRVPNMGSRPSKVVKMPDQVATEMAIGTKPDSHWVKVWAVKYKGIGRTTKWSNVTLSEISPIASRKMIGSLWR